MSADVMTNISHDWKIVPRNAATTKLARKCDSLSLNRADDIGLTLLFHWLLRVVLAGRVLRAFTVA